MAGVGGAGAGAGPSATATVGMPGVDLLKELQAALIPLQTENTKRLVLVQTGDEYHKDFENIYQAIHLFLEALAILIPQYLDEDISTEHKKDILLEFVTVLNRFEQAFIEITSRMERESFLTEAITLGSFRNKFRSLLLGLYNSSEPVKVKADEERLPFVVLPAKVVEIPPTLPWSRLQEIALALSTEFGKCVVRYNKKKKQGCDILAEPHHSKLAFAKEMQEVLFVFQANPRNKKVQLEMIAEMAILLKIAESHPQVCRKVWRWSSKIDELCTQARELVTRYRISLSEDPVAALFEAGSFDLIPTLVELGIINATNVNQRYRYASLEEVTLSMAAVQTGCHNALLDLLLLKADTRLVDSRGWKALDYGLEECLRLDERLRVNLAFAADSLAGAPAPRGSAAAAVAVTVGAPALSSPVSRPRPAVVVPEDGDAFATSIVFIDKKPRGQAAADRVMTRVAFLK